MITWTCEGSNQAQRMVGRGWPSEDSTAGQLLSQVGEKLAAASWAVMRRQE
jgi:hypothetical protein